MNGFTTRAVHGFSLKKDPHGSLRMPVYDNAAFEIGPSRDLELAFAGKKAAHAYSRITNPTVEDFEQRIRILTGAFGVIAVSSGMAAIANTIMTLAEKGSNIVTSRFLFGHSISLFETTFKRWGLETRYVDMLDLSAVKNAIDDKTSLIFLEVITNPQLEIADLKAISSVASDRNIPVVLDGTLTTPYMIRSKDFGIAVEIISSTKYISGGATSVGGLIIDNGIFNWSNFPLLADDAVRVGPGAFISRLRREVYRNFGACLSPHNAWLQALGLETMALRIERSCKNALALAVFLKGHTKVKSVNYPGLPDSPFHEIAQRQFNNLFGGILTFELEGKNESFQLMDSLQLIKRATNLNDNKSLIIHPASTIFADNTIEEKSGMKVSEGLIRLSAGIEDIDDIINDLNQGLEKL